MKHQSSLDVMEMIARQLTIQLKSIDTNVQDYIDMVDRLVKVNQEIRRLRVEKRYQNETRTEA